MMKNRFQALKRVLSLIMVFAIVIGFVPNAALAATPETLYLKPNSNWAKDGARFAAYFFNNSTNQNTWVSMVDTDGDGIYEVEVPSGYPKVIFCRMNGGNTTNDWTNKWNQTGDLTIPTDGKNQFTLPAGAWDNSTSSWGTFVYVEPNFTWTVAGSEALCGSNWAPTDTANDMTKVSTGVFQKVYTDVAKGDYEFKVAKDHDWGESYGNNGDNYAFSVAEDGSTVTITFNSVSKAINVEVVAPAKEYAVTISLGTGLEKVSGAAKATEGQAYTAKIQATDGYALPETVTVKVGGTAIDTFTYENGEITIPAASVIGAIEISATGVKLPAQYDVTFIVTNVTSNGAVKATEGQAYTATLTAADGYTLPETVTVKVGGTAINTFTYENGVITVPAASVTGAIEITAAGVEVPQGYTVYFVNSANWSKVNAYAWTVGSNASWPGVAMTKTGNTVNGFDVYSITFDTEYANIIFNDGSSQTDDLVPQYNKYYDKANNAWYDSLSDIPEEVPDNSYKVYFVNSDNWSKVNAYAWTSASNASWPGAAMEKTGDTVNGKDVYVITLQDSYANIIFNDGSSQTSDLALQKGQYYDKASNKWYASLDDITSGTPTPTPTNEYYLVGYLNNADYSGDDYKFVDGQLTVKFTADSYVAVKETSGDWYLTEEYCTEKTGIFIKGKSQKMLVPAGTEWVFTLVENGDGTLTLSYAEKTAEPANEYYLVGYLNNADYSGDDYKFVDGQLTVKFTADSYVAVKETSGDWYLTEAYCTEKTGTFIKGKSQKMLVPAGTEWVFTLVENGDGTLTLSYAEKTAEPANEYYLVGYLNNADYSGDDYKFVDGQLTVKFTADSYVAVKETSGDWYLTEEYCTEKTGIFIKGKSQKMLVPAGTEWTFTLVENADGTLTLSYAEAESGEDETDKDTYTVIFHFANTIGWSPVNLYVWNDDGATLGSWPGTAVTKADENGYLTMTVSYDAATNKGLNYIFNNGSSQTIDLKLDASLFNEETKTAEVWVELNATANAEGKFELKQIDDAPLADVLLAVSPRINGTSVTFEFAGAAATSVEVRGTVPGTSWDQGIAMTKNAKGLWTVTVDDLEPGIYEYKFVVNGTDWTADPANGKTNADGNSVFTILDPNAVDTNIVHIHVFYNRADGIYFQEDVDGDMDGTWNVSVWGDGFASQRYDFTPDTNDLDGNGNKDQMVTTIRVVGRDTGYVAMKPRMSTDTKEWFREESEARVDLDNIVSGTIFLYIDSDGQNGQKGNMTYSVITGTDIVTANKVTGASYDYEKNTVVVTMLETLAQNGSELQVVDNQNDPDTSIVSAVKASGNTYTLTLNKELSLNEVGNYKVKYDNYYYDIALDDVYASDKFGTEYTYTGTDLGATYTATATTFKVWAPTASSVNVVLYSTGSDREAGAENLGTYAMTGGTAADKGVWTVTIEGDLEGTYYTYEVTNNREIVNACDPYARATGVNGERAMVINLDSTDPDGWASDTNPNPVASQTDAVIYELHVRDFSIDASSGISAANRGKYLAFTEENTTVNGEGNTPSGVDYLADLGITHLHLLPVYDYGSVDETRLNVPQFNWGYDPVNYNVPEGSYSSDPYNGATRVSEFKQMVKSLHDNGISVVMDVVYNHVYNADKFCFNNIVPGYFSRPNSSTSGCGNDTASEREMVRKYIVESVLYWHQEYHIDGFRFDLVGLLDTETIRQVVAEVHACCPDVIFYGEGWDMDSTNKEPGTEMAKQHNASKTPGFAYFSDSMRNNLAGDNGRSTGFASGAGNGGTIAGDWVANAVTWGSVWTTNPQQVVQYASCHDNHTLADKLIKSTNATGVTDNIIKMNNLAAAFYMTAQGVPFIHAGEEILREKVDENGNRAENSYNASDFVNHIKWEDVETYADNVAYYQGLIAFRAANPALRYASSDLVSANVQALTTDPNLLVFRVDANGTADTTDEDILVIFNANKSAKTVTLPEGEWTIYVDGEKAGTTALGTAEESVEVAAISAMVLTTPDLGEDEKAPLGATKEKTIYFSNNKGWEKVYAYAWTDSGETILIGEWPGTEATYVTTNEYGEKVYSIDLPASDTGIEGLIFHNNKGGNENQTVDILPGVDGTGYYPSEQQDDGKWKVGSYTYRAPNLGGADEYFLVGYINGADYVSDDYKFDANGQVKATFGSDSYVYVINGDNSEIYMTDGYLGAVTSGILKDTAKCQMTADKWDKLLIPGGVEVTITMVKNNDNTITLSYEMDLESVTDTTGIQDGVTLHCWNWSFQEIEENMAAIADLGFTAIQTSPIQPLKEATNLDTNSVGSHWWVYYQPVDFVITTDEGNALGTKSDLESMIETAHQYGVQVIVDVVANHLGNKTGNDLSDKIPDYLLAGEFWHDINTNITNWNDRYDMTQNCLDGLPDLNTANEELQGYVLDFLTECIDAGVDGFRFDMAKSIETPLDDESFASDFWPNVIGGAEEYAEAQGKDVYMYGEVLDNSVISIMAYTQYMAVTDNSWGNNVRANVAAGTANLSAGYHKAADANALVIWAESHDTYANNSSSGVSEANINKTWALVAARADAMGLYLARPESLDQDLGVASSTGWDNAEVGEINKFHNAFAGQGEYIANEGNISYVERGTSGVVLVNVKGGTASVNVTANKMADGTYTDQITGNTFTVANGKITGDIGSTGIAVVYNVATYTVTVEEAEGGKAEVSNENPERGETVTVTVTPDAGMELDTIQATAPSGNVTLTKLNDLEYTFKQPAADVTVKVTFQEEGTVVDNNVSVDSNEESGSVSVSDETPETGEEVTITVTPDEGVKVESVTVKDASGNEVEVTDNGDGTYTYIQPEGNVTVEVVFKPDYKITRGNGSSAVHGSESTLTFTANGAFSKFTGIKVDGVTVATTNYEAKAGSTIITLKAAYLKTLSEGEHTITVLFTDGETHGTFTLTKSTTGGGNDGEGGPGETQPDETQPDETQPDETQPTETQPEETKPGTGNVPGTGDNSSLMLFGSLAILSVMALAVMLQEKKRKAAR